jgi:hypothetical protein
VGDAFFVITPALPKGRFQYWANDVEEAQHEAERTLEQIMEFLRAHGLEADGHIGDPDPIQAIEDALHEFAADEMILATHAPAQSIWLERREPERARRFGLPLTHVLVERSSPNRHESSRTARRMRHIPDGNPQKVRMAWTEPGGRRSA